MNCPTRPTASSLPLWVAESFGSLCLFGLIRERAFGWWNRTSTGLVGRGSRVRSPPPLPNQFVFCDLQAPFLTKPCFLTIRFNSPVLLSDSGQLYAAHHRRHGHKFPALFVRQSAAVAAVRQPGLHRLRVGNWLPRASSNGTRRERSLTHPEADAVASLAAYSPRTVCRAD